MNTTSTAPAAKVSARELAAGMDVFIFRATYTVQSVEVIRGGAVVTFTDGEQVNATGATRFLVV